MPSPLLDRCQQAVPVWRDLVAVLALAVLAAGGFVAIACLVAVWVLS